jgi:hypothetical protein
MKRMILGTALALCTFGLAAHAAESSCESQAAEKHLAGAAKTSFLTKCEKTEKATGAQAQCDSQADDKKLHGAARTSFVKKCVADASK